MSKIDRKAISILGGVPAMMLRLARRLTRALADYLAPWLELMVWRGGRLVIREGAELSPAAEGERSPVRHAGARWFRSRHGRAAA